MEQINNNAAEMTAETYWRWEDRVILYGRSPEYRAYIDRVAADEESDWTFYARSVLAAVAYRNKAFQAEISKWHFESAEDYDEWPEENEYEYEGMIDLDDDPVVRERQVEMLRGRFGGATAKETVYLAMQAAREKILQKRNARRKQ